MLRPCTSSFWFAFRALVVTILVAALNPARAALTVLVGEPYGNFGTMMPVGHTAIYLDRVCADGPLKLRMCHPGEPQGVVIARYHQLGEIDWIATPAMQFFYAVDRVEDIPTYATAEEVWALRQAYRQRFLPDLIPDGHERDHATDEWSETAGAAYDRRVWGYRLDTTATQDEALVATINTDANHHRYHLRTANCANFAADIVNAYFPGAVTRGDHFTDFGLMSPKQVARSVAAYGQAHPALDLRIVEIDQVPGSLRRSRPVRSAAEGLLKTKRYLATLTVLQPEIVVGLLGLYLAHGRWQIGKGAEVEDPSLFDSDPSPVVATR